MIIIIILTMYCFYLLRDVLQSVKMLYTDMKRIQIWNILLKIVWSEVEEERTRERRERERRKRNVNVFQLVMMAVCLCLFTIVKLVQWTIMVSHERDIHVFMYAEHYVNDYRSRVLQQNVCHFHTRRNFLLVKYPMQIQLMPWTSFVLLVCIYDYKTKKRIKKRSIIHLTQSPLIFT